MTRSKTSPPRLLTCWAAIAAAVAGLTALPARGSVLFTASGLSASNVPVSFEALLTISGNTLTVKLTNTSPGPSLNPSDVLGSFYFDVKDGANNRPTLTYASAVGNVFLGDKNNPDPLQTANANLIAVNPNDDTWQYKPMNPAQTPFLAFGVGTVGNSNLTNSFNGNIVDGLDFSIYKGDVITANLDGKPLVKETATYTFTGVSGFTEANIVPTAAFGLGTAPDSFLPGNVPEPGSAMLLFTGILAFAANRRRRTRPTRA